jgi:hypothetical protein
MRGEATDTVTYKCEGCGQRKPDGTQLPDPFERTVCSDACLAAALGLYARQRYDNRLLALVGN